MSVINFVPLLPGTEAPSSSPLMTSLLNHFKTPPGSTTVEIDNKYFTAPVELISNSTNDPCEGLILFSDISDAAASSGGSSLLSRLNIIGAKLNFCNARNDDEIDAFDFSSSAKIGSNIRLLVITSPITTTTAINVSDGVINWCVTNSIEIIQPIVDLSPEGISTADFSSREKEGFARVVESLENVVWESAVMKEKQATTPAPVPVSAPSEAPTSTSVLPPAPPTSGAGADQENDDQENDDQENNVIDQNLMAEMNSMFAGAAQENSDNPDIMKELSEIMSEVAAIREASMGGGIDDEARRAGAAEMAERLMGVFGMMGDDDDDDDDDEDIDIYGGIGGEEEDAEEVGSSAGMMEQLAILAKESKRQTTITEENKDLKNTPQCE